MYLGFLCRDRVYVGLSWIVLCRVYISRVHAGLESPETHPQFNALTHVPSFSSILRHILLRLLRHHNSEPAKKAASGHACVKTC